MKSEAEVTKAVARLPGLDIEVRHFQSPDGLAEEISINLRATPSFEVFGRSVEALNPFAFWAAAMHLAWLPWTQAFRGFMPPSFDAFMKPARLPGARSTGGME